MQPRLFVVGFLTGSASCQFFGYSNPILLASEYTAGASQRHLKRGFSITRLSQSASQDQPQDLLAQEPFILTNDTQQQYCVRFL